MTTSKLAYEAAFPDGFVTSVNYVVPKELSDIAEKLEALDVEAGDYTFRFTVEDGCENCPTDEAEEPLPLTAAVHKYNNVAIYACGHIHNFQHIQKKGDNIDYVVNSSSSLARSVKPIDGTVFCSPADGFSVFTADKNQLRMSMIDKDGKIIHTVTKSK